MKPLATELLSKLPLRRSIYVSILVRVSQKLSLQFLHVLELNIIYQYMAPMEVAQYSDRGDGGLSENPYPWLLPLS